MPLVSLTLTLLAAVEAPVTHVTVFADQARVVRTAQVQLTGVQALEFPPLLQAADLSSVRVEAKGAEVKSVDISRVEAEKLRTDEAKAVIAELEKLDTDLARVNGERGALNDQLADLSRITPQVPNADPLKPPAKLNGAGWALSAKFSGDQVEKVQKALRDKDLEQQKLEEKRVLVADKAAKLGQPTVTPGWKVVANLAGTGAATVTLTYVVRGARWTPMWDLQLVPDSNTVNLSLAGLVSQETGEDWTQASLELSTAVPAGAVKVPRLLTWKIGTTDRFIPTPTPMRESIAPPPPLPGVAASRAEEQFLRDQLLRLAGGQAVAQSYAKRDEAPQQKFKRSINRPAPAPPPPPPSMPRGGMPMAPSAQAYEKKAAVDFSGEEIEGDLREPEAPAYEPAPSVQVAAESSRSERYKMVYAKPPPPTSPFSLSPPPAWRPPNYGPDSPVTLAGGYDLLFTSLQKETVPTAKGTRRVALWSEKWPVTVERKVYPALAPEAFLVAELKNPSKQVLPGGSAQLFVGADPAGTARLKLVSPGESFTLPLGIDRALKPVRNVKLVDGVQGLISKDDVSTYVVTIELANPYKAPVAVRIYDQWPVSDQKEVEVKLIETSPAATQDARTGALEWRTTIPALKTTKLSFTYSIKRPHGWRMQQSEVRP